MYRILVGKPEGRRPPAKPRHRWEDNIMMDLWEVGCACVDWMDLAQDTDRCLSLVCVCGEERLGSIKCR
jgi:hypothetical protein